MAKRATLDPLNVNQRLYKQCALILDDLERKPKKDQPPIAFKDRLTALVYIGRIQTIFMGLRKENWDDPSAGSAVRKYASAFKAHAARGGKDPARPGAGSADLAERIGTDWDSDDAAA